jgi:hypothetical protein
MTENVNGGGGFLTTHHVPFVAVRTPSDDSNRLSSFTSSVSRHNPRPSVRKTVKNLFRSSKTIDNMSSVLNNGNHILTNCSKYNQNFLKLKSSSHLSHSQPIVNENFACDSPFLHHSEETPLIERRIESKHLKTLVDNTKHIRSNRQELHLSIDANALPRSRSCNDGIIISSNNQENDSTNPMISSLQPNNSEGASSRSSESTISSLSAYLSTQQVLSNQEKKELNKSQESIFSCSSPIHKHRSFKSLAMEAATQDKATKQDNDVLVLIANWVLRSPEDFQGIEKTKRNFVFI